MEEIRTFFVVGHTANAEDVIAALNFAKENNCIVDLKWYGPAHGYHGNDEYRARIFKTDTPDIAINKLPKIYGL